MITLKVHPAKNWIEKIVGLIGASSPFPLLLKTRFGIHTFGLKFPIDVIILNSHYEVVKLASRLAPNRVFFWNPRYSIILELPTGIIGEKKIRVGSKLRLEGEK